MAGILLNGINYSGGGGGTGDGDMKKSVYNNNNAVSDAGGIKAFVAAQVEENKGV